MAPQAKVYVVIYTVYHHVYKLALEAQKGLEASGVNAKMFQVRETLSDDVLTRIKAPPKPNLPIIAPEQLAEPDGILFGFPTRFGMMPAQFKTFLDGTGALFASQGLRGKFAGIFHSTASQHGGQETTSLTSVPFFVHHGMIFVPLGGAKELSDLSEIVGGSPYGAGAIAGNDASRQPTDKELSLARQQGESFGKVIRNYVAGKDVFKE